MIKSHADPLKLQTPRSHQFSHAHSLFIFYIVELVQFLLICEKSALSFIETLVQWNPY